MSKDPRYNAVRKLIESNSITEFHEIFDVLPKTVLAHDLAKNPGRMTDLVNKAEDLKFRNIYQISNLIGVNYGAICTLIANQYLKKLAAEQSPKK